MLELLYCLWFLNLCIAHAQLTNDWCAVLSSWVRSSTTKCIYYTTFRAVWVESILPATKQALLYNVLVRSRHITYCKEDRAVQHMKNCLTCLARPLWMVVYDYRYVYYGLGLVIVVFTILLRDYGISYVVVVFIVVVVVVVFWASNPIHLLARFTNTQHKV